MNIPFKEDRKITEGLNDQQIKVAVLWWVSILRYRRQSVWTDEIPEEQIGKFSDFLTATLSLIDCESATGKKNSLLYLDPHGHPGGLLRDALEAAEIDQSKSYSRFISLPRGIKMVFLWGRVYLEPAPAIPPLIFDETKEILKHSPQIINWPDSH